MPKRDYHLPKGPIKEQDYLAVWTPWILTQGKRFISRSFRKVRRAIRNSYEGLAQRSHSYQEAERAAQERGSKLSELTRRLNKAESLSRGSCEQILEYQNRLAIASQEIAVRSTRLEEQNKRMHEASLEALAQTRAAYIDGLSSSSTSERVFVLDGLGKVVYESPKSQDIGLGSLIGRNFEDILYGAKSNEKEDAVQAILNDDTKRNGFIGLIRPGRKKALPAEIKVSQGKVLDIETGKLTTYATTVSILNYGFRTTLAQMKKKGARLFQRFLVEAVEVNPEATLEE